MTTKKDTINQHMLLGIKNSIIETESLNSCAIRYVFIHTLFFSVYFFPASLCSPYDMEKPVGVLLRSSDDLAELVESEPEPGSPI